mgnify:CR=1 FL=1
MDKKGFIKTLEAVIAIVLLLGFILFMLSMTKQKEVIAKPFVVKNAQTFILDQVLYDSNLRDCVSNAIVPASCSGDSCKCKNILANPDPNCAELITGTNGIITKNTPPGYGSDCEICQNTPASCADVDAGLKDLYTDARFIGKSGSNDLKVIRIYMFEK